METTGVQNALNSHRNCSSNERAKEEKEMDPKEARGSIQDSMDRTMVDGTTFNQLVPVIPLVVAKAQIPGEAEAMQIWLEIVRTTNGLRQVCKICSFLCLDHHLHRFGERCLLVDQALVLYHMGPDILL